MQYTKQNQLKTYNTHKAHALRGSVEVNLKCPSSHFYLMKINGMTLNDCQMYSQPTFRHGKFDPTTENHSINYVIEYELVRDKYMLIPFCEIFERKYRLRHYEYSSLTDFEYFILWNALISTWFKIRVKNTCGYVDKTFQNGQQQQIYPTKIIQINFRNNVAWVWFKIVCPSLF